MDLSEVATNRITREEFEFSWASGLVRERDFGEFKWELLASGMEDIQGVYEAWWYANTWYPNRPLSERLNMAERAEVVPVIVDFEVAVPRSRPVF